MHIEMCKEKLGENMMLQQKNEINNKVNCPFKWKILHSSSYKDRIEFVVTYRNTHLPSGTKITWDQYDSIAMTKEDRVALF